MPNILKTISLSSANKEITINENSLLSEAMLLYGAISVNTVSPPATPSEYGVYLVSNSSPSGAFASRDNAIAIWIPNTSLAGGYWKFYTPNPNTKVIKLDGSGYYIFNGTSWS